MHSNGRQHYSPELALRHLIDTRSAVAGVIGLGYVGLPLAVELVRARYRTIGFDVNESVVDRVNAGESHILDVPFSVLSPMVSDGMISATVHASDLSACDIISICVPTPLSKTKDPDLAFVIAAAQTVASILRRGQLIILESTTFPGTTQEVVKPILERSGLRAGEDFFLCFSPERVDPGNTVWHTRNTPKVIGGVTPVCGAIGQAFYAAVFDTVIPVENADAAELVKVYENTFRMINIALVNELAQMCERLRVDVWDVLDAAATKPFGFMRFNPGPGLGGHCIPLDPHYLAWKMRTLHFKTRMIETASDVNAEMPQFVVRKAGDVLNQVGRALNASRVLVLGVAYKKDIDDLRESPALEIIHLLQEKGADVAYHDPYCPLIADDGHTAIRGLPMRSLPLTEAVVTMADLVLIATDHSDVDYDLVVNNAPVVFDTRGVLRNASGKARIVGLSGAVENPGVTTGPAARSWASIVKR